MKKPFNSLAGLLGAGILCFSSAALANPCERKVDFWPKTINFGDNTARIFFDSALEIARDCQLFSARGFAAAGGGLFGVEGLFIESTADISIYERRDLEFNSGIAVLGYVVDTYQYQNTVDLNWQDRLQFPIDISDKQLLWVGPVPVNVTYGVEADVGVQYDVTMAFLEANFAVDPFVQSSVYARAGVDVGLASVYASGRIQLLDDQLQSNLWLSMDQVNFDRIDVVASGDNSLEALKGGIEIHASAGLGVWEKNYTEELFSWNGYARTDRLYDVQESFYLR